MIGYVGVFLIGCMVGKYWLADEPKHEYVGNGLPRFRNPPPPPPPPKHTLTPNKMKGKLTVAALQYEGIKLKEGATVWVEYNGIPYRGVFRGITHGEKKILVETMLDGNQVDIKDWKPNQVTVDIEITVKKPEQ